MGPRDAHFAQLWSKIIYTDQRYCSQKINLPNCYCPIFPFLSSWGCININEMLKEKGKKRKKERKSSWTNNNYSVIIQRKIMALLHVWNFPLYFTPAFAKLCANDGNPYIHMNVLCKVEMFSLPGNYFLFQWLSVLFLSPASCLFVFLLSLSVHAVQMRGNCSFFQVPALFNWDKELIFWLSGRYNTRDSWTRGNNPRNPDLIALCFFVEIGKWQHHSVELYQFFFCASWGCHSGPEKLWFIFSLYGYFPVVLRVLNHLQNTEWSSESYRCKEKIVSCFGLSGWRVLGGVILLLWMGSACAHHTGDLTKCSEGGQPKPKVIPTFPASEKLPDSPWSEGELLRDTSVMCLGLFL